MAGLVEVSIGVAVAGLILILQSIFHPKHVWPSNNILPIILWALLADVAMTGKKKCNQNPHKNRQPPNFSVVYRARSFFSCDEGLYLQEYKGRSTGPCSAVPSLSMV